MAILSEVGSGKIYAGATPLAFDAAITQAGDAQLAIDAGVLTTTGGVEHAIAPTVFDLEDGTWALELGTQDDGDPIVAAVPSYPPPAGWTSIQRLAGWGAGIEVVEGAIVGDVYVLEVLPGEP